ncbi:MAG: class I SAM-dependent methyltransferase [Actinomycetota bacterium]
MARRELRTTFDAVADRYHAARPRYPTALLDAVSDHVGSGGRVLEIGPATGIVTIDLAGRGHPVTAIELGARLAEQARANTVGFDVTVVNTSFDTWEAPSAKTFDGVVAATSWHWLDPDTRYQRAHHHLRPGGTLALWGTVHVVPDGGDQFFEELQEVYEAISDGPFTPVTFPRPGEIRQIDDEIERSGLFDEVMVRHFDWEVVYDAEGYIRLLDTFSEIIAMGGDARRHLYGEIRTRLARRPDGLLRRHWGAALHLARAVA